VGGGKGEKSNLFRAGSFRDSPVRNSGNVTIPSSSRKEDPTNDDDHYLSRAEEGLSLGSLTGRKTSVKDTTAAATVSTGDSKFPAGTDAVGGGTTTNAKADVEVDNEVEVEDPDEARSPLPLSSSAAIQSLYKQGSKGYESGSEVDYHGGTDDEDDDDNDDDRDDDNDGGAGNDDRGGDSENDEEAAGGGNPARKDEGAISQYEVDLMTGILR
jgi:hypothetical protein